MDMEAIAPIIDAIGGVEYDAGKNVSERLDKGVKFDGFTGTSDQEAFRQDQSSQLPPSKDGGMKPRS
ncbi:MAG: hypothetical protein PWP48_1776 [Clostridiales bacterium]|nr:hypothetical protein [Clostridiales bacterium]MDK2992543.1 hypothetical protein [Clostridiales bacterium]